MLCSHALNGIESMPAAALASPQDKAAPMLRTLISMSSILSGLALLLVGVGLLGTLLGIRAGIEGFSESVTGVVMACYFGGYLIGTEAAPAPTA